MLSNAQKGTVEGTGSAINVSVGFVPARVMLVNIDGDVTMQWDNNMVDGQGFKSVAAGTQSLVASNGVSAYAGAEASAAAGFTIGTDSDINGSAETIHWYAFRE